VATIDQKVAVPKPYSDDRGLVKAKRYSERRPNDISAPEDSAVSPADLLHSAGAV
jgi:hypothetical protein